MLVREKKVSLRSVSWVAIQVVLQVIEKTIYFVLVIIFNHFNQLIILLCLLYIWLQTNHFPYLMPQFQLTMRCLLLHFLLLLNITSSFLKHASESIPNDRESVCSPFLPVDMFLSERTELIVIRLFEHDGGIESFLTPFRFFEVWEVVSGMIMEHSRSSSAQVF